MRIYVMAWEEIECGWGTRPDGWSVHISPEEYERYLRRHRALHDEYVERRRAQTTNLPLEYSQPISDVALREFDFPDNHALSRRLTAEKSLRIGRYEDDRDELERLTGLKWRGL